MSEQPATYLAERPHALYSPSRLPYLEACLGWVSDGAPGPLAERGTRVGELLARWALAAEDPLLDTPAEDQDAIAYGMNALLRIMDSYLGMEWHAEPFLATGLRDCGGYADLLGLDLLLGEAVLVEIKTSRGKRAPAADNRQVQAYALGVLNEHPGVDVVYAYLIECDLERTSEAVFRRADTRTLRSICKAIIINAQTATDATLRPGPQCRYCARREQCPRLVEAPELALALIGERALSPKDYAEALSPGALGETLARVAPLADLVESYVGALKARTMQILEAGGEVPGWAIKTSSGYRSWIDADEASTALQDAGLDLGNVMTLVTPAQVEKILGKSAKAVIAPYVQQGKRRSLTQIAIVEDVA
jgi:CRISPR/Cas system-associated exonuclease Cas4 (RecB family)